MERLDQPDSPVITGDERTFGMLTHLSAILGFFMPFGSIIGPLVAWGLKKQESKFVYENGRAALNFHITWTIALAVLWTVFVMRVIGSLPWLAMLNGSADIDEDFPLRFLLRSFTILIPIGIVYMFRLIMILAGTISASNGRVFKYPTAYPFIK